MPIYRLVNSMTGKTEQVRRMDHEVARVRNAERDDGLRWEHGLDPKGKRQPVKTVTKVLRALDAEGFNEDSLKTLMAWFDTNATQIDTRRRKYRETRRRFADVMRRLPAADRQLVGRFFAFQASVVMEAGVKLGLAGKITQEARELEATALCEFSEEWAPPEGNNEDGRS